MIENDVMTLQVPKGYELILKACTDAMQRAAVGKGRKRHADHDNQPLEQQQIYIYSHGFRRDQIRKKAGELERLRLRDQLGELLDIIVYASVEYDIVKHKLEKDIAKEH